MIQNHSVMAHLKLVGADIQRSISRISDLGIRLYDIEYEDELTAFLYVSRHDYKQVILLLESYGNTVTLLNSSTQLYPFFSFWKRPVLTIGLLSIVLMSILLSEKILFVRVTGNENVPATQILEEASSCGVKFFGDAASVRSEQIKNRLLQKIPQLQWAGVNINGCVATVSVEEKAAVEQIDPVQGTVSSIVASCDGIIDSVTVLNGNCLCKTGQAVKAGQTLISGYTDCGLQIIAEQARGEVYAKTIHNICAVFPTNYQFRGNEMDTKVSYRIKIGKNIIIFRKDSGISPGVCVNMYEERCLSLPGGFRLPVSVVRITEICYNTHSRNIQLDKLQCEDSAQQYLLTNMIAGQVLRTDVQWHNGEQVAVMNGQYLCSEMIGRTKTEHMIQGDTKRD